jgi:hypothetical protein
MPYNFEHNRQKQSLTLWVLLMQYNGFEKQKESSIIFKNATYLGLFAIFILRTQNILSFFSLICTKAHFVLMGMYGDPYMVIEAYIKWHFSEKSKYRET